MNDKDFKESMDGLPQELERVYGKAWRNVSTLDDLTAADARRHQESQREAAESADEKPDGQAENARGMARELAAQDSESPTKQNG